MDISGIDSCGCGGSQERMDVEFDVALVIAFLEHSVVEDVRYL
jgi:hypothetical protein